MRILGKLQPLKGVRMKITSLYCFLKVVGGCSRTLNLYLLQSSSKLNGIQDDLQSEENNITYFIGHEKYVKL